MYGATDTLRSYTEKRGKAAIIFLTGSLTKGSRRPALPQCKLQNQSVLCGIIIQGSCCRLRFYPAMRGMALWVFSYVVAVSCAGCAVPPSLPGFCGRDAKVRFAAAVTRSLLPVCRDFPVVHPLRFRGLTFQLPSAVRVGLRLSLRPCVPAGPAKMEARHRPVLRNM